MRQSRPRLAIIVVAIVAACLIAPAAVAAKGQPPAFPRQGTAELARNSWIVTLEEGVDIGRARAIARNAGGRAGLLYGHALHGFQFNGSAKAAAALARNPRVASVEADRPVYLTETVPFGIERVHAWSSAGETEGAWQAGYRGAGARIAILDTGIDMDHPDLVANIDAASSKNCLSVTVPPAPPEDGHGHGTHVSGTAAAPVNGEGVVGIAPEAELVAIKMFDDAGNSSEALSLCALDWVTALNTDGNATNDIDVASMSWGEHRTFGSCATDPLHGAICRARASGAILVAGAGNDAGTADDFVPAAFPEVISVSGLADFDGQPGGLAGCTFVPSLLWFECDDTFAFFSNSGASVDVIAPAVSVHSTWTGGGYQTIDGTSMATPHVSGVVALMRAADATITPSEALELLLASGECPNGTVANADDTAGCAGQGAWTEDPDGLAEPLPSALRASEAASVAAGAPTIEITNPPQGAVAGIVDVSATASDDVAVVRVDFAVNNRTIASDTNGSDGWSFAWDTGALFSGVYSLSATAVDTDDLRDSDVVQVLAGSNLQGDWVGAYGADGYALLAWNGTTDLTNLPGVSLVLDHGVRHTWAPSSTEPRVLESPDETERRSTIWFDDIQLRLHLTFDAAYTGTLHLYAVDWSTIDRRQKVTVNDGTGPQAVTLSTAFDNGAWLHFPISVAAGGTVNITADRLAGYNAILSGLFLGEGEAAPTTMPSAPQNVTADAFPSKVTLNWSAPASNGGSEVIGYEVYRGTMSGAWTLLASLEDLLTHEDTSVVVGETYYYVVRAWNVAGAGPYGPERKATLPELSGAQGDWVGAYGADGYALLAWNGTTDLTNLPGVSLVLDHGVRHTWAPSSTEPRVLESPDETERRSTIWFDDIQLRLHLTFDAAYTGTLHLYAVDWSTIDRRQKVTVNDGTGPQAVTLSTAFDNGAWLHFPISVAAGGTVNITADRLAGYNAILSGLFLGEGEAAPPEATPPGPPTLSSVTPGNGQVALLWSPPAADGGSAITGYVATASPGGGTCATSGATSCSIAGLTNGISYTFAVTATNAVGTGPASNSLTATPRTVPGAPVLNSATSGNGQVAISWNAPVSDGGSSITGYVATASPGGMTCSTSGTMACTVTGLVNGTPYSFVVRATNAAGTGAPSNALSATPRTLPAAPTLTSATPGNAQVALVGPRQCQTAAARLPATPSRPTLVARPARRAAPWRAPSPA